MVFFRSLPLSGFRTLGLGIVYECTLGCEGRKQWGGTWENCLLLDTRTKSPSPQPGFFLFPILTLSLSAPLPFLSLRSFCLYRKVIIIESSKMAALLHFPH